MKFNTDKREILLYKRQLINELNVWGDKNSILVGWYTVMRLAESASKLAMILCSFKIMFVGEAKVKPEMRIMITSNDIL